MSRSQPDHIEIKFLRKLCPDVSEEKIREAEVLYLRFLELRLQIFERVENEERGYPQADHLTENRSDGINSK